MVQNNMIRVAAYARVSTDKDDQTNSLASQRKYFADYIQNHRGWELFDVYYDEGASGTQTKKRMGFNQMIGDALSYTRKLKEAGVDVVFTIDNIDTRERWSTRKTYYESLVYPCFFLKNIIL